MHHQHMAPHRREGGLGRGGGGGGGHHFSAGRHGGGVGGIRCTGAGLFFGRIPGLAMNKSAGGGLRVLPLGGSRS